MPTKVFVTELVNAFNLNNYFSDNIYTNFTVQGGTKGKNDKIVSSFGRDGDIKKYLKEVREEIIRQHYSNEEAAGGFYNLNCLPFVFDVDFNKKGKFINQNVKVVELANLTDSKVIHNLKLHFANEFQERVEAGVTGELKAMGMTKDEALKCVRKSVQLERVGKPSPYLYCISFGDGYFKEIGHPNPSRFLELFRNVYVAKFNLRLERCGLNDSSIFYEQRDNKLYIKDITDINVIKDIVRYVKERIALDFKTPGDVDSKVENCKDAINDLIFKITGKFIEGCEYDVFTNKDKIKSGHSFALIPLVEVNGQVVPLSGEDAYKIKKKFYEILGDVVFSNIKGETKDELGQISSSEGPVYAFSNKQIALLLPIIMQSPIAYNQINGRFEFAVDLENFKRRGSSRSSSTVASPFNSPTHAGPSGLETPPNPRKRNRDSGIGESPTKLEDSGASSGGPRSLFEQPQAQKCPTRSPDGALDGPPRQWSEREEETGRVLREEIGQASTSSQQTDDMPHRSYTSRCRQEPLMSQPSTLRELLLSEGVYESMPIEIRDQKMTCRPSSIPFPTAWDNSISLNFGVSEDSPKDTENICNEEPEKQQVTDKSDRKSSDECSEAKSQDSKYPKKHGGGLFCKKGMPILAKSSPFKRRSVERDTMCSSKSDLVYHVTEKSSVSKPFFSFPTRIKAKSNPPSGVTSPTHEGGPEWQQRLSPDQREELCKVLSPEMKEKLNSGFFLPGYEKLLHLLYVDSEILHSLLSTSEGAEQVCSVLPPEKGKQLHSGLPFKTKKGLLFTFFDDEQEISRNVSTSSADSGYSSGLPASPAVPHKESVSSEFKKCSVQQVKHMSEALEKNGGF
ncbi:hypothetical protein [Wolbachia endosymbiont (group A) of Icerya purchasi]|uniref:hypothetical protein n=1 Tax=Wolbachia endosymbiont (group A) of Icerya purchasi TaxID=2954019 RepID=UPI00222F23FF|nr:hypothetical protein [Wolbachia endosymbiont (group A) of Icerya purchasi]